MIYHDIILKYSFLGQKSQIHMLLFSIIQQRIKRHAKLTLQCTPFPICLIELSLQREN